jgi:hypothetical protein
MLFQEVDKEMTGSLAVWFVARLKPVKAGKPLRAPILFPFLSLWPGPQHREVGGFGDESQ